MDALARNKNLNITDINENSNEAIVTESFIENRQKIAYKIGWTTNIAGESEFCQKYMECETCQNFLDQDEPVEICLCWVEFWHAGHKTRPPRSQMVKIVCSWGSNKYPKCPLSSKENPLEKSKGAQYLEGIRWSILKDGNIFNSNSKTTFRLKHKIAKEISSNLDVSPRLFTGDKDFEYYEEDKANTALELIEDDKSRIETDQNLINNTFDENINHENLFNDEDELKEKFQEELSQYSSEDFISDLILSLQFDLSQVKINSPKLFKNMFYTYDESLWRYVHLYEHFILLAHGFWRPGFVRILSCEKEIDTMYPTNKTNSDVNYTSFICLVSLMQGDFEYFLRYWKGFMKSLDIKEGSGSSFTQKAARLLMLCHGYTHYTEIDEISGVKNEYERMFRELFPKKYNTIILLHKLATLTREELISLFTYKKMTSQGQKSQNDKDLYDKLVKELLFKKLELDQSSVEWIGSLTRICMGDETGIDYICKVYGISSSKINIYKAIWSDDNLTIIPLFEALKDEIPIDLWKSILNILKGNSEAVCDVILRSIRMDKSGNVIFEDLTEVETKLKLLLSNLFQLTESDHIDKEILSEILK